MVDDYLVSFTGHLNHVDRLFDYLLIFVVFLVPLLVNCFLLCCNLAVLLWRNVVMNVVAVLEEEASLVHLVHVSQI